MSTTGKPGLIAAIIVALSGCSDPAAEAGSPAESAVPVEVAAARAENVSIEITAVASLDSELDAVLRAEVGGRIHGPMVAEGERVSEGTSLMRIDSRVYEIRLERARSAVEQAEAQFRNDSLRAERTRALLEAGAVDPQTLDDLEARLAQSRAQLVSARVSEEMAEHDYARSLVPAPFGGVFLDRRIDHGDYVQASDPLGRLLDLDSLRLTFRVPEVYAANLSPGDEVRFTANALEEAGRELSARIYYVSPSVSVETRTAEVKARTPNPQGMLWPGMSAEATVVVSGETGGPSTVVPEVAVRSVEGGGSRLFIVSGDTARSVPVETGVRPEPGSIVVRGEVKEGDRVVVAGFQRLEDGTRVTVADRDRGRTGASRSAPPVDPGSDSP